MRRSKPGERRGGRKAGTPNKRTIERERAARDTVAKVTRAMKAAELAPLEGDAHSLLVTVYKDRALPMELRVDAAKAAIRNEKPALAQIQAEIKGDVTAYVIGGAPMSEEEWVAAYGVQADRT